MGQGGIKGVKRRVSLRVRGGGVHWQFQVRDEEECWMAIYRAEREKKGAAAAAETASKSNI